MLTIENGTGVTGADSFITVAELDAYSQAYFNQAAHDGNANKEAALRRVFVYMKGLSWKAAYPWPTMGGTIPDDIKLAQAILAYWEALTPNVLQPNVTPGQLKILTRVGELGWTATGQSGADAQRLRVTMALDLLSGYINANSNVQFIARA
jgi:hypothetical protein